MHCGGGGGGAGGGNQFPWIGPCSFQDPEGQACTYLKEWIPWAKGEMPPRIHVPESS